ncbi:hypothetical protein H8E65_01115 [Candidatus Bathyarchaeota archaeon]|nr:hypothetical protein [Candidatus Bathyarchaeota archaeon]MBL7079961.1 hypothetical protein [Candidatus Bathyarchaeota archaeon]
MAERVSRAERAYSRKVKDAVHLLFFTHHRLPGVRGWELRQELGTEWLQVIDVLDEQLKPLDLRVTRALEDPDIVEPTSAQLTDARFYITMRGSVDQKMSKSIGWRIDDIAGLAVAIAYLISKQGKSPRTEVEKILSEKLPGWRTKMNIDRYIRQGYLGEDDRGTLFIGWRSRAEVDQKQLVDLVVGFGRKTSS